jgi:alpha-tubulin suppressor-like RCC1 family protein
MNLALPLGNLSPDLASPHLLRSLRTVKVVSIHTSSHSSHAVALDVHGVAHLWGRASSSALGLPNVAAVWEEVPVKIRPSDLGAQPGCKFIYAATGRAHTLLVGSDGTVWSAGINTNGQVCLVLVVTTLLLGCLPITFHEQCGHSPSAEVSPFKAIAGEWKGSGDKVIQAAAGVNFSIVLTASGRGEAHVAVLVIEGLQTRV